MSMSLSACLQRATGITCNSKEVRPGTIFVAIRGRRADGNHYIMEAVRAGALAIVTDNCRLFPLPVPIFAVENARSEFAKLAAQFYQHPSTRLQVTGVTGTNGKTTITYMLDHIVSCAGHKSGMIGTVKVKLGTVCLPSVLTTPDAGRLQQYLAQMCANGVTHAAMEVSAQGMEMHRADCIRFACGILTNITPDHLDFHTTFDEYFKAKQRFVGILASAPLVVNSADIHCMEIAAKHRGLVLTAAIGSEADITAYIRSETSFGSQAVIRLHKALHTTGGQIIPPQEICVRLPLPGRHNIENALLATAGALLQGVDGDTIAHALSTFPGVERRMTVHHLAGRCIIDDTALNPGSIDAVFKTLTRFPHRRILVAYAIRGHRGAAINATNAAAIAAWQKELPFTLVITGATDKVDTANAVTQEERQAFCQVLDQQATVYTYTPTLQPAMQLLENASVPGDLLVLIGAQGMDYGWQTLSGLLEDTPAQVFANSQTESLQFGGA